MQYVKLLKTAVRHHILCRGFHKYLYKWQGRYSNGCLLNLVKNTLHRTFTSRNSITSIFATKKIEIKITVFHIHNEHPTRDSWSSGWKVKKRNCHPQLSSIVLILHRQIWIQFLSRLSSFHLQVTQDTKKFFRK